MIEMIEQDILNHADFLLGPNFFLWPDEYFQLMTSSVLNPEIPYKMQN